MRKRLTRFLLLIIGVLAGYACQPNSSTTVPTDTGIGVAGVTATHGITPTAYPTRPRYNPGELVEYIVQMGDTLPALAVHFNSSVEEIRAANPIIPADATTLPEGLPLAMPIYYRPFWGSPYQIIPDSQFVNGPAAVEFDTDSFVNSHPGWLREYTEYAAEENRTGAQIIDYVAVSFSVSPRVLLAILEFQANALSSQILIPEIQEYPLGNTDANYHGLYLQLVWAANLLNNGYYGWRGGELVSFDLPDGRIVQPDPWQNAATVGLQYYFNTALAPSEFSNAIGPDGFALLYQNLFGDVWNTEAHIPGSLRQPDFQLPFEPNTPWTLTGGPHVGWGEQAGKPRSALDFAPPSEASGCVQSEEWATAIASGVVVRSERGRVALDLDGDGDERTGWVIFYLHVEKRGRAEVGAVLEAGDYVGHPSCEGGIATGSHVHIARKYNGEWMPAGGVIPFIMEGWLPYAGELAYEGGMVRFGQTVVACECSSEDNQITSTREPEESP